MKVVINKCFGGFGLSAKAVELYAKLSGVKVYGYCEKREHIGSSLSFSGRPIVRYNTEENPFIIYWIKNDLGDVADSKKLNEAEWLHEREIPRHDVNLIKAVEKLGKEANGSHSSLSVVEIPDDVEYDIDEYDGLESIHEKHRSWG